MSYTVYIINLDKDTERLQKSTERLAEHGLSIERIPGILGKALSSEERQQHYSEKVNTADYHKELNAGQIGCYLSHREAWRRIAESDDAFGVVLEDDIHITGDLRAALATIETLAFEWDVIKLAAYQNSTRPIRYSHRVNEDFELVIHKKPMSGCAASAYTKAAAKRLLAATDKFGRPVDTDLQHFWEKDVRILSLMPYPVAQDMDFESTMAYKTDRGRSFFWRRKLQQIKNGRRNTREVTQQIADFKKLIS